MATVKEFNIKMRMILKKAFYAGVFISAGVVFLLQDLLGKERYIKFIQEYWVDLPLAIPFGIFLYGCFWLWKCFSLFPISDRRIKKYDQKG